MRGTRAVATLLLLVLLAAACGQKSGVAGSAAGGDAFATGSGEVEAGAGATDDLGEGVVPGDTTGGGTTDPGTGATGGTGSGGGTATGGTTGTPTAGGGTTAGSTSSGPAPAGDRTGITDTNIKIGLHAPLTGAAPVPTEAFRRGLPVYWNFVQKSERGVFGRKVDVVFKDDEFNPSTAVRVCREMVEQEKVLLLIGIAGADQITACAKYANSAGVPYISAGVNEEGLTGLRGYFAASQTYAQQSPVLGQLAKKLSQAGKVAIVVENTPTFRESKASAENAMKSQGLNIVYSKFISKGASQAEILTTTNDLRASGADVVYYLGPPITFISLATQGQSQGFVPNYIGPGLSNGLNLVAQAGCPGIGSARFLSPFPQTDAIDRLDPNYTKEYRAQNPRETPDDLGIGLWGLNKSLHQVLKAAGKDMTRQSLVATMESGRAFESGVFPKTQYSAKNHFGADSAHLLVADCGSRTFKTEATFVRSL